MTITTPEWVKHAIFYQIFPDRFARSPRMQHEKGIAFKPWGTPPEEQGFQGGDLRGVTDKLDYLHDLGITAIYLNPIFASACNHRYHTFDYLQVDPLLGGNEALRELLDAAHARQIKIVLDGVFNHASRGFWAFHHILETGQDSPYLDWFTVQRWPLRPYSSTKTRPPNYLCWWNLPALPKFNTNNPGVREYIFNVAHYWIDFGIDGWRLDVPMEINDDSFWQEFRRVVKSANPDAYICGEIWEDAQRWLHSDQFDAVMNYLFMDAAISFCGAQTLRPDYKRQHLALTPLDAPAVAKSIDRMYGLYDWAINHVQLNLLDSHDTARALWIMGEDKSALRLCVLLQMTLPGAPCIYYGDEIGLSAGDDPSCRGAFPWDNTAVWDNDLLAFYRRATALRHRYPVLRTGAFQPILAEGNVYVFARKLEDQEAVVALNTDSAPAKVQINAAELASTTWQPVWPERAGQYFQAYEQFIELTIPAREAVMLLKTP